MKHFIASIMAACLALSAAAQFGIGLRDTRYVNVNYTFARYFNVELEHSVYAEKFKCQHIRFAAAYTRDVSNWRFQAKPYFGTLYNGNYYDLGALATVQYRPIERLALEGTLNPHYDSGLKYKTCFRNITTPTARELQMTNPLAAARAFKKGCKLSKAKRQAPGMHTIVLIPNERGDVKGITLDIDRNTYLLRTAVFVMNNGQHFAITLTNYKTGVALPASTFTYDPSQVPAGTEVVDLR